MSMRKKGRGEPRRGTSPYNPKWGKAQGREACPLHEKVKTDGEVAICKNEGDSNAVPLGH